VTRNIDYAEVGLIAGLEVHQQLLTSHKMFCRCPAGLYSRTHDGVVLRHMRPTLSELGEYDGTALMEFRTKKNIVYLLDNRNVCTYEMDDTPPFLVNQEAIDIAIEQCLMLGCDIVDEVHIARKQYLDGSIPTGFQRTAIVGVNGSLPFRGRTLSVTQVSVEEDSCREVSDEGHLIVWRTDRLGMPLIETVTGPDLRTPDEVEEAILLIGRVCRSTRHVRVGMGASRQDVNVSVRGGRRVEIKGVPQAGWAPKLVHGEAVRQVNLLALRDELRRRGFRTPADLRIRHESVTELFRASAFGALRGDAWARFVEERNRRPGMELGEGAFTVRAIRLEGMAHILTHPTQPDHTFAHEIAGRVRVIAGLDQQPILLHDDRWPDYADSLSELRRLKERLGCGPGDALVVVWGPDSDTITAAEEVEKRLVDALDGIPQETRQPFRDGRTDFERILPGPDRMYPDTDSPPTRVTRERVERLGTALPAPPWVREARYAGAGVPLPTIHFLIRRGGADLVDRVVEATSGVGAGAGGRTDPVEEDRVRRALRHACFFFGERVKGWRRAGVPVEAISAARWVELFRLLEERPILGEALARVVRKVASAPARSVADAIGDLGLDPPPSGWEDEIVRTVRQGRGENRALSPEGRRRLHIGRAMAWLRGRVPASRVIGAVEAALARVSNGSVAGGARKASER